MSSPQRFKFNESKVYELELDENSRSLLDFNCSQKSGSFLKIMLEEISEFYLYYSAGRARIGPTFGSLDSWIFSEFLGQQHSRLTLDTRWFSKDLDGEVAEIPVRIIQLGKPISFTITLKFRT